MKQLTIFSLIGVWLCFLSCGEEEISAPTIVKDTVPPTIIATNVQGGPIPTNTPINDGKKPSDEEALFGVRSVKPAGRSATSWGQIRVDY